MEKECKECSKCKDCIFARRVDRWNIVCTHEKWHDSVWGNTSPRMGNATEACDDFQDKNMRRQ